MRLGSRHMGEPSTGGIWRGSAREREGEEGVGRERERERERDRE
jgi:hypothetical protein